MNQQQTTKATPGTGAGGPTTLYRYYDTAGALLYVGITEHPLARADSHANASTWWPKVATARFEQFPTRDEASAAEREAIRVERPLHNNLRYPLPGPKGPVGRPVVGKPINLRLGPDLQARVDAAALPGEKRAATIRRLLEKALESE